MLKLSVPEMSCGHCVATISNAIRRIDPEARIESDLQARSISIDSRESADHLREAIRVAGYEARATT